MNVLKTLLATTTAIAAISLNSANANGFFSVGYEQMSQLQPVSFNSKVHNGTTFWDYYNNGHTSTVNKNAKMVSFDDSKLGNLYLAPLYN